METKDYQIKENRENSKEHVPKWVEIKNEHFDDLQGCIMIDAWKTSKDSEEGMVVAKVFADGRHPVYLNEDARANEKIQRSVSEAIEKIKTHPESYIQKAPLMIESELSSDGIYETQMSSVVKSNGEKIAYAYLEKKIGGTEKDVKASLYLYGDEPIYLHPMTIQYNEEGELTLGEGVGETELHAELERVEDAIDILICYQKELRLSLQGIWKNKK